MLYYESESTNRPVSGWELALGKCQGEISQEGEGWQLHVVEWRSKIRVGIVKNFLKN